MARLRVGILVLGKGLLVQPNREETMLRRRGSPGSGCQWIGDVYLKSAFVVLLLLLHPTTGVAQGQSVQVPLRQTQVGDGILRVQETAKEAADQPTVAGNFLVLLVVSFALQARKAGWSPQLLVVIPRQVRNSPEMDND